MCKLFVGLVLCVVDFKFDVVNVVVLVSLVKN